MTARLPEVQQGVIARHDLPKRVYDVVVSTMVIVLKLGPKLGRESTAAWFIWIWQHSIFGTASFQTYYSFVINSREKYIMRNTRSSVVCVWLTWGSDITAMIHNMIIPHFKWLCYSLPFKVYSRCGSRRHYI